MNGKFDHSIFGDKDKGSIFDERGVQRGKGMLIQGGTMSQIRS
jgi:hypothetical protein